MLVDCESGAVLYQKSADPPLPPASLTKLMTLAVALKALKDGQIALNRSVKVSEYAWRTGGAPSRTSAMFIPINTCEPVEAIIRGIIVQSGNDGSIALAEELAGSEAAFAGLMNDEAARIGLRRSRFLNATGLDADGHVMTARDVARLSQHLIREYPEYYAYFSEREFRYRKHRFISRNPLLAIDAAVDGLMTGHTSASGYGIAASATRDGRRLIAVVPGSPMATRRAADTRRLLDWGFATISDQQLFEAGDIVAHARVWGGTMLYLPLKADTELKIPMLQPLNSQRLTAHIVYQHPLKPPIEKGHVVAKLRVRGTEGAEFEAPLVAAVPVEHGGVVRRGIDTLLIRAARLIGL
jgi:D-alanyl-D-alanine carboxypeptidase (penicillin-binding protein 5/6)